MAVVEERLTRLERTEASNAERLASLEGAYGHLATKADIERLEKMFTERMAEMESDMTRRMTAIEVSMTRRMAQMEVHMTRWLVGTMIAGFALVIAALKLPPIG